MSVHPKLLAQKGIAVSHPVIAALNSRILRPGSSSNTDNLLKAIMCDWASKEKRLGIEIDPKIFAYVMSEENDLDQALVQLSQVPIATEKDLRQWRFGSIYSFLWPRGGIVRSQKLDAFNPFAPLPKTERLLVIDCLERPPAYVDIDDSDWRDKYEKSLKEYGVAILKCPQIRAKEARDALNHLLVNPLDAQFLFFYPRIRSVLMTASHIEITLEIAESMQ